MVLAPRHVESLSEPKIEINVSRQTEVIPHARFAGIGVAEILVNLGKAATAASEELGVTRSRTARTWVNRLDGSHVGLDVPVGGPTSIIKRRGRRQSRVPTVDAGELPATQNGVYATTGVTHQCPALAKGQLPHRIGIDGVPDVEIGVGIAVALTDGVDDKRAIAVVIAVAGFRLQPRCVI